MANTEAKNLTNAKYAKSEKGKATAERYLSSEKGKGTKAEYMKSYRKSKKYKEYVSNYNRTNRGKRKARRIAMTAYPIAEACSHDNCDNIGERHHDDYDKPLAIRWLCAEHHVLAHREESNDRT